MKIGEILEGGPEAMPRIVGDFRRRRGWLMGAVDTVSPLQQPARALVNHELEPSREPILCNAGRLADR